MPASSRSPSAATTRSRSPSCGCSPPGTGPSPRAPGGAPSIALPDRRLHASRRGPLTPGQLGAHGDTWGEFFGQRYFHGTSFLRADEEKLIEPAASVQAGLRGSLFADEDL